MLTNTCHSLILPPMLMYKICDSDVFTHKFLAPRKAARFCPCYSMIKETWSLEVNEIHGIHK